MVWYHTVVTYGIILGFLGIFGYLIWELFKNRIKGGKNMARYTEEQQIPGTEPVAAPVAPIAPAPVVAPVAEPAQPTLEQVINSILERLTVLESATFRKQ